jgi:hypothetical protein
MKTDKEKYVDIVVDTAKVDPNLEFSHEHTCISGEEIKRNVMTVRNKYITTQLSNVDRDDYYEIIHCYLNRMPVELARESNTIPSPTSES